MGDPEQARAAQLRNIESRTGHSLQALRAAIAASGKAKHGEIRSWLIEAYALGYGDANGLAAHYLDAQTGQQPDGDPLDAIYTGKKAHLRGVHDALLAALTAFGEFEIAPKKANVSLRRKKQFATLGPKNATHAELGINSNEDLAGPRVLAQKPGGMCQFAALLGGPGDIDAEIMTALRRAYDAAG